MEVDRLGIRRKQRILLRFLPEVPGAGTDAARGTGATDRGTVEGTAERAWNRSVERVLAERGGGTEGSVCRGTDARTAEQTRSSSGHARLDGTRDLLMDLRLAACRQIPDLGHRCRGNLATIDARMLHDGDLCEGRIAEPRELRRRTAGHGHGAKDERQEHEQFRDTHDNSPPLGNH
ncbi:MAG: hypothetical protein JWN90_63 [Parcubacteria group bacterium]|nr:hypothetical protein [Parcubacteria group bacterium]